MKNNEKKRISIPGIRKEDREKEENLFKAICKWVYKLRSVFLSIPVAFASVILALTNLARLPNVITVYMPAVKDGVLALSTMELARGGAVLLPLLLTAACIVMVLLSRRVLYPWLISLLTLAVPIFFYYISIFP